MEQTDSIFSKGTCEKCGYKHATNNYSKDGTIKFFLCERCGFQHTKSAEEEMKMEGVGSYSFVGMGGIVAGGVFEQLETFFERADELTKSVQGAKLFYTERGKDNGKYYLINYDTKQTYEFGVDDIICWDGLKKPDPSNGLKATYTKK
jgi:hypothetical protein